MESCIGLKQSEKSVFLLKSLLTVLSLVTIVSSVSIAFADAEYDEKLAFAGSLEETLGHLWAIEQNLDDHNAELALVHATHPIAELYDMMKPDLEKSSPDLDAQVKQILFDLGKKTSKDVTRQDAQKAIDEAKGVVEIARTAVVGDELSKDTNFKMKLMQGLLETSKGEYEEAVSNGQIGMMAEFQDGSAFVWRSQQIFNEIKSELPKEEVAEIEEFYEDLWTGYDQKADPEDIETMANGVVHELDVIMGVEGEDTESIDYVENIRSLLQETKKEYAAGNTNEALSLATKAYLDNFEFLESPIGEQNPELNHEMEQMMRVELRDMIKNGSPVSEVNAHIDKILLKMNDVAKIVPEFPFGALIAMTSVIGIVIAITKIKGYKLVQK